MKLLPIKPVKQGKRMCGPASLKMVLSYYGIEKSEKELAKIMNSSIIKGTSEDAMLSVAKKFGFKAKYTRGNNLKDVTYWINKKVPVIVGWFSEKSGSHFSVVVGLDKEHIFLVDSDYGSVIKLKHKEFIGRWFDVDWRKFGFVHKILLALVMTMHNLYVKVLYLDYHLPLNKNKLAFREMIVVYK